MKFSAIRFRVQEAIINLIRKKPAADYTPSGGFIHISMEQPKDSRTEIMVCDSGEGIPEERWKDIFRRFYTSSVTETGASAGIGLNLAYEIVTVHGGFWSWFHMREREPGFESRCINNCQKTLK